MVVLTKKHSLFFIPGAIVGVYACFFTASASNPGVINSKNVEKACAMWDYDYILFNPKVCSTFCRILQNEMEKRNVWSLYVYDKETYQKTKITTWQAVMYIGQVEPILSALALFAGIAGMVVLVFMIYQGSMVLRGVTTNEAFKWDDLKYDIKMKHIENIPKDLHDFNQSYVVKSKRGKKQGKAGKAAKNKAVFVPSDDESIEKIPLTNIKQIRNIYDEGAFSNLMEMIFPSRI
ncbi:hypothetical protein HDU97_003267 [Phlyctochytrium planicorne]|nr:hypothetical protein HDU97_003267 [Phlyctochytrium planicorne]